MKTLRYLLTAFAVMMVMSVNAQSLAQQPTTEFHSTSSMVGSGSTLPQAVQTGAYTTYDVNNGTTRSNKAGIRTAGPGQTGGDGQPPEREDPYYTPIGDGVWVLLLCAAVFSGIIAFRRKRQAQMTR